MVYCLTELERKLKREKRKLTTEDLDGLIAFIKRSPYAWVARVADEVRPFPAPSKRIRRYVDVHHWVDDGWGVFDNYAEGLRQRVDESFAAEEASNRSVVIKTETSETPP